MVQQKLTVINPTGLHLRPAAVLAKTATECKSEITILFKEKRINAKSALNIMAAAVKAGSEVTVVCEGESEEADLKTIVDAIESGLGELD